jgi:hypothetical protein
VRRDVFINSVESLFAVSSRDLGGRDRASISADLRAGVADSVVFPLAMARPEPFVVRIVEGELSDPESGEWVGHISGSLFCPRGIMNLEGGFGSHPDPNSLRQIQVPSGRLRLDLYTYLGGSANGEACYQQVSGGLRLGRWFRETRPGEEFPDWLALRCMQQPVLDPGFEADWRELAASRTLARTRSRLQGRPAVAFVLQIRPGGGVIAPPPVDARGTIAANSGARLPDFCPRGLDATVAFEQESEETDLPMASELPEAVRADPAGPGRSSWNWLKRWFLRGS